MCDDFSYKHMHSVGSASSCTFTSILRTHSTYWFIDFKYMFTVNTSAHISTAASNISLQTHRGTFSVWYFQLYRHSRYPPNYIQWIFMIAHNFSVTHIQIHPHRLCRPGNSIIEEVQTAFFIRACLRLLNPKCNTTELGANNALPIYLHSTAKICVRCLREGGC